MNGTKNHVMRTFDHQGQFEDLHFRPRRERQIDRDRPSNEETPSRDADQILHLVIPLSFDNDALRVFRIIFTRTSNNCHLLRSREFRLESARAMRDSLQPPNDGTIFT